MSDYKISIIIPTFNLEHVLDKTFKSLKKQTIGFNNIEIIFVDDCSNDNTYTLLSKYADNHENVKVLTTEENSGFAGKPRNLGIVNSNSEYILFLDGDDQLLIDSCATLYNNITQNNLDIIIGGHINQYENGRLEHIPPMYFGDKEFFKDMENATLFKIMPAIGAKLFKKELLIKNNILFPERISGEDLVFLLNAIINSNEICVLNNFYVYYRNISNNSVTFNLTKKYFIGLIKAYSLICDLFKKHEINYDIQEMLLTNHLVFFTRQILRAYSNNEFDNAQLTEILNSKPFNELSQKDQFNGNVIFEEYFRNMNDGYYNNFPLLKKISDKFKPELINEYSFLKENNEELVNKNNYLITQNSELNNQINNMKKDNDILKSKLLNLTTENEGLYSKNNSLKTENNDLKRELSEIKSSRLWKLKNKL